MSVFTNEVDVFTLKTTNINICISPILKVKIMENGIKMGVNLSDYVNYVLTKSMMGQMETDVESTPQYKKLKEAYETLEAVNEQDQERLATMSKRIASLQNQLLATQMELSKYETQVAPFKENVGNPIIIQGKVYQAAHASEILGIILKTFDFKN